MNIRPSIKKIIEEEAERHGVSQTEYIERLVEGTLLSRLEEKIESVRSSIDPDFVLANNFIGQFKKGHTLSDQVRIWGELIEKLNKLEPDEAKRVLVVIGESIDSDIERLRKNVIDGK